MRKRMLTALLVLLMFTPFGLVGCGGGDGPTTLNEDSTGTADEGGGDDISLQSPDAGNMATDECDNIGFVAAQHIAQSMPDYETMVYVGLTSENAPFDELAVELYYSTEYNGPKTAGTYELNGENYATCGLCLLIRTNCSPAPSGQGLVCDKEFLATTGTVQLTKADPNGTGLAGTLTNVVFEEVAINPDTWQSQAVLNAESWCIPSYNFTGDFASDPGNTNPFNGDMPIATTPADAGCVTNGNGTLVGSNIANFSLQNCNGDTLDLHEYCGSKVVHLKGVTGWCPACMADMEADAAEYGNPLTDEKVQAKRPGYRIVYVLGENAQNGPPTAVFCSQFAQQHGVDPSYLYMDYGNNVPIPLIFPEGSGITAGSLATVWTHINPYLTAQGNSVEIPFPWDAVMRGTNMEYRTSTTFSPGGNLYSIIDQLMNE